MKNPEKAAIASLFGIFRYYSNSIVPGGFEVMS